MSIETGILMAILVPLGIILLGFGGYMYDRINKHNKIENKYKGDFLDGHRKVHNIFFFAPIEFMSISIKNKNLKDIIIGVIFFSLLIGTIIMALILNVMRNAG